MLIGDQRAKISLGECLMETLENPPKHPTAEEISVPHTQILESSISVILFTTQIMSFSGSETAMRKKIDKLFMMGKLVLKDVQAFILETCEHVTLHVRMHLADAIKVMELDYPAGPNLITRTLRSNELYFLLNTPDGVQATGCQNIVSWHLRKHQIETDCLS